jgi:hypothetical protein
MKRLMAGVVLGGLVATTAGCAELLKLIGSATASAITQKTTDLKNVAIQGHYVTNLFPASTPTIETEMWGERWKTGGGVAYVNCLKRSGVGMFEIDGTVTCRKGNGAPEPMTYGGSGSYSVMLPPGDTTPRTIDIATSEGHTSFTLKPVPGLKLKAINGKSTGATFEMGKDVTLDLDLGPSKSADKLKVSIIASSIGIRNMADVGIFKPASRIVIPGAAFRHLSQSASLESAVQVETGDNLLLVERFHDEIPAAGVAGAVQTIGKAWTYLPVTVTGDGKSRNGFHVGGTAGDAWYRLDKPNAFYSRPIAAAKRLALGGLRLRGTLFRQMSSVSESYGYNARIITTTTTTWQFPQLPNATWDGVLNEMNSSMRGMFKSDFGIDLLPPNILASSPTFQSMETFNEQNDQVYIERNFPGTHSVFPISAVNLLKSVSSTFAADRPPSRVLREAGADGILTVDLDLQVGSEKDSNHVVLVPALKFSIVGPTNGYAIGPTVYASGTVALSDGVPFNEAEVRTPAGLARVIRLNDLMKTLRQALTAFKAKETSEGYTAIWALN